MIVYELFSRKYIVNQLFQTACHIVWNNGFTYDRIITAKYHIDDGITHITVTDIYFKGMQHSLVNLIASTYMTVMLENP